MKMKLVHLVVIGAYGWVDPIFPAPQHTSSEILFRALASYGVKK